MRFITLNLNTLALTFNIPCILDSYLAPPKKKEKKKMCSLPLNFTEHLPLAFLWKILVIYDNVSVALHMLVFFVGRHFIY